MHTLDDLLSCIVGVIGFFIVIIFMVRAWWVATAPCRRPVEPFPLP